MMNSPETSTEAMPAMDSERVSFGLGSFFFPDLFNNILSCKKFVISAYREKQAEGKLPQALQPGRLKRRVYHSQSRIECKGVNGRANTSVFNFQRTHLYPWSLLFVKRGTGGH